MQRPCRFVDIQNFEQELDERQDELDEEEFKREAKFLEASPHQTNDVISVLEVTKHEKKSMYGKGLSRRKHNPHRNADLLGVVSFWRTQDGDGEGDDKRVTMQIPRCVGSFYVPNPIHYSIGGF